MQNQELFEHALRILSQSEELGGIEDYEERAPFRIASFCTQAASLDHRLRESLSLPPVKIFHSAYLELDEEFPLLDRLIPLACLYLAAMLVLEENESLSDKLYDRYSEGMSAVWNEIPAVLESIRNEYFTEA